MQCKIEGCGRLVIEYTKLCLCQKHYFRMWRNGTTDLIRSRKYRRVNPAGYQLLYIPEHKLASQGYVYEHRKVIYDIYGNDLPKCQLCGNEINWESCHIDHIDNDVTNNNASNLRPVCPGCNTGRTERSTIVKYTFNGETLSLTDWAKKPFVKICRAQLKRRLDKGMDFESALLSEKITHK